jgi:hypothetical protein
LSKFIRSFFTRQPSNECVMSASSTVPNIVEMKKYRREMKHPVVLQLLNYWEGLRADRVAPFRSEIDPSGIEDVLPHVFVLQKMSDAGIRIRLAGQVLTDVLDIEMRGMAAQSIVAKDDRDRFLEIAHKCLSGPLICEVLLQNDVGNMFQVLMLPLRDATGSVTRIIGAIVCQGQASLSLPSGRMRILRTKETRIIASLPINPLEQSIDDCVGFAEPALAFDPKPIPSRETPYLRLVK